MAREYYKCKLGKLTTSESQPYKITTTNNCDNPHIVSAALKIFLACIFKIHLASTSGIIALDSRMSNISICEEPDRR